MDEQMKEGVSMESSGSLRWHSYRYCSVLLWDEDTTDIKSSSSEFSRRYWRRAVGRPCLLQVYTAKLIIPSPEIEPQWLTKPHFLLPNFPSVLPSFCLSFVLPVRPSVIRWFLPCSIGLYLWSSSLLHPYVLRLSWSSVSPAVLSHTFRCSSLFPHPYVPSAYGKRMWGVVAQW